MIFCLHEFGDSFSCGLYFSFPERTKKRKIRRKTRTLRAHREGEATFFLCYRTNHPLRKLCS